MDESCEIAMTYCKSRTDLVKPEFWKSNKVVLHFGPGGVGKDGPSAGVAICCVILSAATKTALRTDVAVTGEVFPDGSVHKVGGVREKAGGAFLDGVSYVCVPTGSRV